MSLYAFICLPSSSVETVRTAFGAKVHVTDATLFAVGHALSGERPKRSCYMLQARTDSSSLVMQMGNVRLTHNNNHSHLLVKGIENLLKEVRSVDLLFHIYRGSLVEEPVTVAKKEKFPFVEFASHLPNLEADVKYTIRTWRAWLWEDTCAPLRTSLL